MPVLGTPVRVTTLMQIYAGSPVPVTSASNDAIKDFQAYGLVELDSGKGWEVTEKGKFLVEYLLDTPVPETVTTYSIKRKE